MDTNMPPFVCPRCPESFKWKQLLVRHLKSVHNNSEFSCMKTMGRGKFLKMMSEEVTLRPMGRGKFLKMMAEEVTLRPNILMSIECIAHHQKNNQTIPHCQKCCQYELWTPATNQPTTCSGDNFIS